MKEAAKGADRSINQLNELLNTGKAPKSIKGFNVGKVKGEKNHVHFYNGAAFISNKIYSTSYRYTSKEL